MATVRLGPEILFALEMKGQVLRSTQFLLKLNPLSYGIYSTAQIYINCAYFKHTYRSIYTCIHSRKATVTGYKSQKCASRNATIVYQDRRIHTTFASDVLLLLNAISFIVV